MPTDTVLVCGGRNYNNRARVFEVLNDLCRQRRIRGIIQGGATGADALAKEWQAIRIRREAAVLLERRKATPRSQRDYNNIQYDPDLWSVECKAQWTDLETPPVLIRTRRDGAKYNALAGSIRNAFMLQWHPTKVVAFPGGSGTADMCKQARAAGLEPIIVTD
jgi:hypothetical protein